MSFAQVVNHILSEITPSREEKRNAELIASEVKLMISNELIKRNIYTETILGGSFARHTFLKGIHDIDIFIRFKKKDEIKKLSEIIKSIFPDAKNVKGSRDYFTVNYKGINFEFIPVLMIKTPLDAVNSMDASYFHVNYLNTRLNDKLRSEILLLKQFCKACGVYGAESHIGGFSGYVLELLILHFGSFKKFIEFLNKSNNRLFIDMEGYYDSINDALNVLKVNKQITPVVIVDPVLPTRNAAAGLTFDAFNKFILKARLFLLKPSKSFFLIKQRTINNLKELSILRDHPLFTNKFKIKGRKEVFLSKLNKEISKMKLMIEREGFNVYDYGVLENGTAFFELEYSHLPRVKRVIGPPITIDEEHFKSFLNKKAVNGPYVFNGRICFDVERKYYNAKPLIEKLFRNIKI